MSVFNFIFLEAISILIINIVMLIYSLISSDQLTSMISFTIYIILLTPFLLILREFKSYTIFLYYDLSYYELMMHALLSVNFFVGLFLLIQIIYLFLFS
ncbi:MAG: conserved membrane protein of unknown function [Promethearchaeota archaeon]|nr:MAG: conserved membrane protein of unknown function [Candidatus Lokiarchaeota archaeon]